MAGSGSSGTLGERIRQARLARGLTQRQLGGRDFTPAFISQIERGLVLPSLPSLQRLAHRLGVTVGDLLGEAGGRRARAAAEAHLDAAECHLLARDPAPAGEHLAQAAALLAESEAGAAGPPGSTSPGGPQPERHHRLLFLQAWHAFQSHRLQDALDAAGRALAAAEAAADAEQVAACCELLARAQERLGRHVIAIELCKRGLAALTPDERPATMPPGRALRRLRLCTLLALLYEAVGEPEPAAQFAAEATAGAAALADPIGWARAMLETVDFAEMGEHADQAARRAHGALAVFQAVEAVRSAGEAFVEAAAQARRSAGRGGGGAHRPARGRPAGGTAEPEALLEQARARFDRAGYAPGRARVLLEMAELRLHRGNVHGAIRTAEQALAAARALGDATLTGRALAVLAEAAAATGGLREAARLLEMAAQAFGEGGLRRARAEALARLGGVYRRLGRDERALAALEEATRLFAQEEGAVNS